MMLYSFKTSTAFGQASRDHLKALTIQSQPLAPVSPIPSR